MGLGPSVADRGTVSSMTRPSLEQDLLDTEISLRFSGGAGRGLRLQPPPPLPVLPLQSQSGRSATAEALHAFSAQSFWLRISSTFPWPSVLQKPCGSLPGTWWTRKL